MVSGAMESCVMTLEITNIETPADEQWADIWTACPYATFFHSPSWYGVFRDYTEQQIVPEPILISFSDGKKAIFPLACHRVARGMVRRYLSAPASSIGGWISTDDLQTVHAQLIADYMLESYKILIVRANPHQPAMTFQSRLPEKMDQTQILTLSQDFTSVYAKFSKRHKTYINKAKRNDVTVRIADTASEWEEMYALYLETFKRWGDSATSKYRPSFFEIIRDLRSPYVRLWVAEHQGRMVAGVIMFYSKELVMYGYPASRTDAQDLRASDLMVSEIIRHACEQGFRAFDFNPSSGHQGVIEYKKRFGSEFVDCPIWSSQPGWLSWAERCYKSWLIKSGR